MKFLVVLVGCVALCASHSIPTIPGDNSHYVEGESQYIWMSDDKGEPVLVDLYEPVDQELLMTRNGANNAYWLFTRRNPTNAQVLVNNNQNSVWNSNFISSQPTKVIVHGWNNNGNTAMNSLITSAFLAIADSNVIVVDWRALASQGYASAVSGVPSVGQHLGNFLVWLMNLTNGNWNNVHLVGFSLGAHIVGVAGRQAGGRPSRITGLDPAGPFWQTNNNRLSPNAGQYVEAIHTDGNLLGIFNPVGHADFYPNGGRNPQPGCGNSSCSHGRSTELFAATVRFNHLIGFLCPNVSQAGQGTCSGAQFRMGNGLANKRGSGIYALSTGSSWPF